MSRFRDRPLEWIDVNPLFEACPTSGHVRNAIAFIQRLKTEGSSLFKEGTPQMDRWNEGCLELENHIKALGGVDGPNLATALRKFIHSFEHTEGRVYQMLHGLAGIVQDRTRLRQVLGWFDLAYRRSTYAIIASHCPDKNPPSTHGTKINVTTGEVTEEGKRGEATVPKKYRHATNKIQ